MKSLSADNQIKLVENVIGDGNIKKVSCHSEVVKSDGGGLIEER